MIDRVYQFYVDWLGAGFLPIFLVLTLPVLVILVAYFIFNSIFKKAGTSFAKSLWYLTLAKSVVILLGFLLLLFSFPFFILCNLGLGEYPGDAIWSPVLDCSVFTTIIAVIGVFLLFVSRKIG